MKLPRDFYRQIISRNHCAVFSERIVECRHRALRQSAVADEFCIYSERRGDGEQETQSRSALAAVENAAVMQLVKTAEGCARVLGGAERFGIFFACERHGCHQPVRVRLRRRSFESAPKRARCYPDIHCALRQREYMLSSSSGLVLYRMHSPILVGRMRFIPAELHFLSRCMTPASS